MQVNNVLVMSVHLSVCKSVCVCVCLSVCLSVCLCVRERERESLFVCLSVQTITFESLHIELHFWCGGTSLLPPSNKVCKGNVFTGVCLSMEVSVRGVSVQRGSLSRGISVQGDLCPGGSLSRGISVQVVSVQGSLSRGSLSRGLCPGGLSYGEAWAVRIRLECILVISRFSLSMKVIQLRSRSYQQNNALTHFNILILCMWL